MNINKQLTAYLAVLLGLFALTGCSNRESLQSPHEINFSLDNISEITIMYDEEEIAFHESENNKLTIKEYMTENKSSYYAKVEKRSNSIKISEGSKPILKDGFFRCIEVYLPASYYENLTVTTTDGNIDISEIGISLNSLRVDSTAGTIFLNAVEAQNIYLSTTSGIIEAGCMKADIIKIATTSGNFTCKQMCGNVSYATTSGNADIKSAAGAGNYKVNNSGKLNVIYTDVTGDLSFYNKNNEISITLPADLEFEFDVRTKNGSISASFQEYVSIDGRRTSGTIGEHPTATVTAETNNGNIEMKQ